MAELVDSHCHLDEPRFDADRQAVVARAIEKGVTRIVVPGVDLPSSRAAVALAQQYALVYAAIGFHPHLSKELNAGALEELDKLAASPKLAAVGEIGLDYYRDWSPRNVQRRAFEAQLEWAAQLGLPVIVHDRDAHNDVLAILRGWCASLKTRGSRLCGQAGVLHSFSGDAALAERTLALGFYIGISGPVTYRNAERLREAVRAVPLERLLVETDAPYLTPHPHRGRRNEPAHVRLVAQAVAEVVGLTLDQVMAQTAANARTLFGWSGDGE